MGKNNAGGTDRGKRLAILNYARADSSRSVIACAADNRRSRLQSGQSRRFFGNIAGNIGRFIDLSEKVLNPMWM